jgi:DNA-binding Lrp family transcriptional regulator
VIEMVRNGQAQPNRAKIAEEQKTAFDMKRDGATYREIAEELGCAISTAHKRVDDACAAVISPSVEEIRVTETARLDRLQGALKDGVAAGEVPAVDASRRLSESLRKLHGADAPVRSELEIKAQLEVSSELTSQVIVATVRAVVAALAADRSMPSHMIEAYAISYAAYQLGHLSGADGEAPQAPVRVVSGRIISTGAEGPTDGASLVQLELEAVQREFPELGWSEGEQ